MSLQVGFACYADAGSAGAASCSQFGTQISTLSSGQIQSLSCLSADPSTGALTIQSATASVGASPVVATTVIQPVYQPCMYGDWMAAGTTIFFACMAVWAVWYGWKRTESLLNWSRGDAQ